MNITLKSMGLMLALMLAAMAGSTTVAHAQSPFHGNAFSLQAKNQERGKSNQNRSQRSENQRSFDERRGNANRAENSNQGRRDPRLSPDERRTLRRQIDEAGRDIYSPRR